MKKEQTIKSGQLEFIRVIVIDDSAFMRKSLTLMLESDPEIIVVATARDGNEGIEKINEYRPDIVTLDIEMPGMDGLTALKKIMESMPLPVLMVSSLTTESAEATLKSFDLGAVDFISKDLASVSSNIVNIKDELINKVKQIVRSKSIQTQFRMKRLVKTYSGVRSKPINYSQTVPTYNPHINYQGVMIAVSTGGPQALCNLIPKLPEKFPLGVSIVQHMPPQFTRTLAERLNNLSNIMVKEAENGEKFEPQKALVAPGGKQMVYKKSGSEILIEITDKPYDILYKPSANLMMSSAVSVFSGPLIGVIMTGMGSDGVQGLKKIKAKGGYTIAQNEESCVVFGMPQSAINEGVVDTVLSIDNISLALNKMVNTE